MISNPDFIGKHSRLEVRRSVQEMEEVVGMLRSYGFHVEVEIHCGFHLIHWTFPRLRRVK